MSQTDVRFTERKTKGKYTLQRAAFFDASAVNHNERTVELIFSTENPVDQWFGIEVLGHGKEECDLTRFDTGTAALLCDHNWSDQVGVIVSASIGADRVGRAVVRFGKSERAEEIFQDVVDGIRRNISVGYMVNRMILEEAGKEGQPSKYRVVSWTPFEISIVSVPADIEAGVGRTAQVEEREIIVIEPTSSIISQERTMNQEVQVAQVAATPASQVNIKVVEDAARQAETDRVRNIYGYARQWSGKVGGLEDLADKAVARGASVAEFQSELLGMLSKNPESGVRVADTKSGSIGLTQKEASGFSFIRAINAVLSNDFGNAGFEREVIEATRKQFGGRGAITVPYEVLVAAKRDLTVGGAGTGAEFVGTTLDGANFIDALRPMLISSELGVQFVGGLVGNVAFPKITGGATAYWITEGSDVTESTPTTGQVEMSPKTVGSKVDISRKLLLQSTPSAEAWVRNDMLQRLAIGIDTAIFSGSGTSGQPTGIVNTSGVGSATISGSFSWANALELESDVATLNALAGSLAYVTTPAIRGTAKQTLKSSGVSGYIWDPQGINGYKAVASTIAPASKVVFGDYSQVIVGQWGALDINLDTASLSSSGGLRMVVLQDIDIGIRNAGAFSIAA